MLNGCATNRDLVAAVAAKLTEIHMLMKAVRDARNSGDNTLAEELNKQVEVAFKEKDRCVEAWTRHHREHGC